MDGIGGVHKERRSARAVERGHQFAGDVGAFADARDDYAAFDSEQRGHAAGKIGGVAYGLSHVAQGVGFFEQHLAGYGQHIDGRGQHGKV